MSTKILTNTLKMADGGRVECHIAASDGTVIKGFIEQNFFEELMVPGMKLTPQRLGVMIRDNLEFLEARADEQIIAGSREIVIR